MAADTTTTAEPLPAWIGKQFAEFGTHKEGEWLFLEGTTAKLHSDGTVTRGIGNDVTSYPSLAAFLGDLIEAGDPDDAIEVLTDLRDHAFLIAQSAAKGRLVHDGDRGRYLVINEEWHASERKYSADLEALYFSLGDVIDGVTAEAMYGS